MLKIAKFLTLLSLVSFLGTLGFAKSAKSSKNKEPVEKAPEWMNNPLAVYPQGQYFQAVGSAATRNAAELEAVKGIASIFSQSVQAVTTSSRRMAQAVKDGKVSNIDVSGISQDTASKVNMDDLIGVEIKGYWQDTKNNIWYVIAVLDKPKVSSIYSTMILKNISEIDELMNIDATDTASYYTFETFARFDLAKDIAIANENYYSRLSIVNPSGAAVLKDKIISSKEVKGKTLEISKEIPIAVIVEGDRENRLKQAFSNVIANAGFRTSDLKGERYTINAQASFEEAQTQSGTTVHCRYNVNAPLKDNVLDEVLLPFSVSGREAMTDYAAAQYRAYKTLETKIKADFTKSFNNYVANIAAY